MGIISSHVSKHEARVTVPMACALTLIVPARYVVTLQYISKVLFQILIYTYHYFNFVVSCSLPYRMIWVTWRSCCEMRVAMLSIYNVLPSTVLRARLPHEPSWQFFAFSALMTLHVLYMNMLFFVIRYFTFCVYVVNNNVSVFVADGQIKYPQRMMMFLQKLLREYLIFSPLYPSISGARGWTVNVLWTTNGFLLSSGFQNLVLNLTNDINILT